MPNLHVDLENARPVAVGGIGGSGTRIIAKLLQELGFFIGSDLNEPNDNLWFTLLFKRIEILMASKSEFETSLDIFMLAMNGGSKFHHSQKRLMRDLASADRYLHRSIELGLVTEPAEWLHSRVNSLLSRQQVEPTAQPLAWKEPNTHVVLGRLAACMPQMKYIHVVRNGLDMAYSPNQNQLMFWGPQFITGDIQNTPYFSLKFWRIVHQRILSIGGEMGARFLLLNFDQFCRDPLQGVKQLMEFLQLQTDYPRVNPLSQLVRIPRSLGRYKQYGLAEFDPADIAFVREMGFDTKPE